MDETELSTRHRGRNLDSKKLSALERLKKIRQGEKVDEPEETEEDLYEYVEEEEEEEEEYVSKSKNKSSKHKEKETKKQQTLQSSVNRSRHLTKEKTSSLNDDNETTTTPTDAKQDIRTAFFRASANAKPKSEKKLDSNQDDDLANEIMQELTNKKTTVNKNLAQRPLAKPSPTLTSGGRPTPYIPFATNSPRANSNNILSLSPAHKRKLSPSKSNLSGDTQRQYAKKIELDQELVQQLIDSDSNHGLVNDENDKNQETKVVLIKSEPMCFEEKGKTTTTSEKTDDDCNEELENLEILSHLSLEANNCAALAKHLNLPVKQETTTNMSNLNNSTMDMSTSMMMTDDADISMQIKNLGKADKILVYWLDAYEEQFNSTSTIYLFGKMPLLKQVKEEEPTTTTTTTATTTSVENKDQLSFVSVCCIIKNVPKIVYILPRKYRKSKVKRENDDLDLVSLEDVEKEIDSLMERHKIMQYKVKRVKKMFAFDRHVRPGAAAASGDEVPYESEYVQLEYMADRHASNLQLDSLEGECFSVVFNANASHLEQVLIDLKLKGPSWLLIQNAKRRETTDSGANLSWCKLEYVIDDYKSISIYHEDTMLDNPKIHLPPTPPLTVLTLLMRTTLNPKSQEHEIVCACGLVTQKLHIEKATVPSTINKQAQFYDTYFCTVTKPHNTTFPHDFQQVTKSMQKSFKIEPHNSERALLSYLLCKIQSFDVDIIIGHDLFGFNFDILLNRCLVNKVPHWSRLGRLKRATMPNMPSHSSNKKTFTPSSNTMNLIIQQRIQTVCSGRLLCDIMISAKELLTKCKSFDLPELVSHILFKKDKSAMLKRDVEEEKNITVCYNNSNSLIKFLQLAMLDVTSILKICNDLQCLQLAYQITCIAGNVLSRTLTGGRSERNEYLLLHAFYDKEFILPEKYSYQAIKNRNASKQVQHQGASNKTMVKSEPMTQNDEDREDEMLSSMVMGNDGEMSVLKQEKSETAGKNTHTASHNGYQGGLVLDPKIGFYDKFILLLDFNSLYPSIIQEYNICFTTISRPQNELLDRDVEEYIETCIKLPAQDEKPGILPLEIKKLVDSRRQVKQLMADKSLSADLRMQYDIRQKALKLTANSLYGCLGFENSRFYCKPLAALITKLGRGLLMKTKELVESKKIEVIYGDTDSLMINTNLNDYDQVIKLGTMLKGEVNKMYRHLEIDIDGVFKCLLLLRKKKYAALTIVGRNPKDQSLEYQQEIKGLDVVRRDWCILAKQIGEKVIGEILSGQACDIVLTNINKILNETAEKIKNNAYDLSLFEISKQLNRNPEDYSDANHQSHVLVALRHNQDVNNSKKYRNGDVVSYVICEDGSQGLSATQRAYSQTELLKSPETLKLDTKYYLTQQVHPVVTRLCEPIEGIDSYHVAEALGLDPSGFKHKSAGSGGANGTVQMAPPQLTKQQKRLESLVNELEKFGNCVPFKYICPGCKTESHWQSPFVKQQNSTKVKQEASTQDVNMEDDDDALAGFDHISAVNTTAKKSASSTSTSTSSDYRCILDSCSNPNCKVKPVTKLAYIKNTLTLQLNKFIKQYYQAWLVCDDPMCSFRTKRISCKYFHGKTQCIECEKYNATLEYTDADLYYQMRFFRFIFDVESYKNYYKDDAAEVTNLVRNNKELQLGLLQLREHVNKKLKNNAYGIVSLTDLFKCLM